MPNQNAFHTGQSSAARSTRSERRQPRLMAQPGHEAKALDSGNGRAKPSEDIWVQLEVNGIHFNFSLVLLSTILEIWHMQLCEDDGQIIVESVIIFRWQHGQHHLHCKVTHPDGF
eukprot:s861_g32.t1